MTTRAHGSARSGSSPEWGALNSAIVPNGVAVRKLSNALAILRCPGDFVDDIVRGSTTREDADPEQQKQSVLGAIVARRESGQTETRPRASEACGCTNRSPRHFRELSANPALEIRVGVSIGRQPVHACRSMFRSSTSWMTSYDPAGRKSGTSGTSRDQPNHGREIFAAGASYFAPATGSGPSGDAPAATTGWPCSCIGGVDPGASMTHPDPEVHRHPIGTLAIVGIYGVLFAVGWLLVYVYVYLSRGPVTP
jgi:hypothetical protein